ncbi:MAG TPA: SDR family oxidoreductase [Candidatus Nitrosotalea sp.]|nr:SDR family oxidoreductase [Candidatus Nitrosotalea sp.]
MAEKTLVIGAGFLGKHVIHEFNNLGIECFGSHFSTTDEKMFSLDIQNMESLNQYAEKFRPDIIINCAANVQIDFLENNPEIAYSINSQGAKNVAMLCEKMKIRLVHISTDGIFDGIRGMYTEEDMPNPINIYAQSKALGEKFVKENTDNYVIIRTNFYGHNHEGKFLFNWILNTLKQKKELVGFDDIIFTPLEVSNLARMIFEISMTDYSGIIHLSSNMPISKYQFALEIAKAFEFDAGLIQKGSIDDAKLVAKRPKNTSLSNQKAKKIIKTPIISLSEWLRNMKSSI